MAASKKLQKMQKMLNKEKVTAVYQPVISLTDGDLLGYESLMKIHTEEWRLYTDEMIQMADSNEEVWEADALYRKKSLEQVAGNLKGAKLFLNVDAHMMRNIKSRDSETIKYMGEYGINPEDLIFELTEQMVLQDAEGYGRIIRYYQQKGFQIVISRFSGNTRHLEKVCGMEPDFIKLDKCCIRNINSEKNKQNWLAKTMEY